MPNEWPKDDQSGQELIKCAKKCKKLPKDAKRWQRLPKVDKNDESGQKMQKKSRKLPKIALSWLTLAKFA